MSSIILNDVGLRYPNSPHATLKDINLELGAKDSTVIIGPSGCGKTSLLNIVAGFINPTHGTITQDNKPITSPDARRVVVFQDDALMPWLNVADNVALGLKLQKKNAKDAKELALKALEKVNLAHSAHKNIWELSGGMRQRVGIARALAVQSEFLLLDEPFGALDAFTREQMQELVLRIFKHQNTGVFLITHDIEEALLLATQLVIMAPYPGNIYEIIKPKFVQEWQEGKSVRQIRSSKEFIELRESLFFKLNAHSAGNYEVAI